MFAKRAAPPAPIVMAPPRLPPNPPVIPVDPDVPAQSNTPPQVLHWPPGSSGLAWELIDRLRASAVRLPETVPVGDAKRPARRLPRT